MFSAAPYRVLMIVSSTLFADLAQSQEISPIYEGKSVDTVLCDGVAAVQGRWKSRLVQVLAPGNKLELREYQVFDPEPGRGLEFFWKPENPGSDGPGRVSGHGSLTWRDHAHMAWDPASVVKSFNGDMRDGKPEGNGEFVSADGVVYDGAWRDGRPNGEGQLQLPTGEIFRGKFRSGCADGSGMFIDTTNERFEGLFHGGKRDGAGKTTLPNGFSYTSRWSRGVEAAGSQRIRVAQLNQNLGLPGSDIRMGVTVQRRPELPKDVSIDDVITYASTPVDGGILVQPANKDLVSVWKGAGQIQTSLIDGEIHSGIFNYNDDFVKSTVPIFLIDVQNKTTNRIQITSFRLDVAESRPDLQPAIQMVILASDDCGPVYNTSFRFDNFGWSPAKDVKINYRFTKSRAGGDSTASSQFRIGDIQGSKQMSFDRELEKFGVNVRKLNPPPQEKDGVSSGHEFPCHGDLEKCLDAIRNDPVFGSLGKYLTVSGSAIMLGAQGTIEYTWVDDRSEEHSRVSPYRVSLEIGHFRMLAECGEGPTPEAIQHSPLHLRLAGTNYSIAVPFKKPVEAGQSARFTLRLEADQASGHKFSIVAVLANGGEIASRSVSLLFFRPRPLLSR
ncbi:MULTISPECIES: hypothetical protein [unclassified Bradyrhizobium]|uniref:hypothetical protein n=1 Tax=unclassified Bradyrhizobium TaxID=2631580 RepID=UPI002915E9CE|nr:MULTISPECIES: hypothetical protein [unclassified Bradyrhizobium]